MKDIIKIALGVAGGLILASLAWITVSAIIAKSEVDQLNKITHDATVQMQVIAQQAAQKQKEMAATKAATDAAQREANEQAQRDQQAALDLRIEKDKAWKNFFTKSKECENPPTMSALGECANIAIRSKRKFEEQWLLAHPNKQG